MELPTEEYDAALRVDIEARHPEAIRFVLEHLVGLDAMLSVAVACVCAADAREMSAKRSRESVGSLASDDSDSDDDLYDL